MFSFIYMRILESQPRRYDLGISWLSLGVIDRIRRAVVDQSIRPGDRVLDIGTGTGALALLAAARGAEIVGIDVSRAMLDVAEAKRHAAAYGDHIRFIEAGVAEMDNIPADSPFDVAVAVLLFSELSEDEQHYALRQARRLLKPGGRLVIVDEVRPSRLWQRFVYILLRWPLRMLTFLFTQTTTRAVNGIEGKVTAAGFTIKSTQRHNMNTLLVLFAEKKESS